MEERPPTQLRIRDIVDLANRVSPDELAERVAPHIMVAAPVDALVPQTWTFETRAIGDGSGLVPGVDFQDYLLYPLRGRRRLFRTVISVGRSESSDVCIRHETVSKVHARIEVRSADHVVIADAGSRQGTLVNGRALAAGEKTLLNHRDDVTLGDRTMKFYRTSRLHATLTSLVSASVPIGDWYRDDDDD